MKIGIACRYRFKKDKKSQEMVDARSMIHSEQLLDLFRTLVIAKAAPQTGNGSIAEPYQPKSVSEWYYLAMQEPGKDPTFVNVGGRLIARWGTGGGQFVNYCTDVTTWEEAITANCIGKPSYENFIRHDVADAFERFDRSIGMDVDNLNSYTRKALRLDYTRASLSLGQMSDREAAMRTRGLLNGIGDCDDCFELASSVCSLFLSEAARLPATFLISLMLLDLVETSTTYGKGGAKRYTWRSMLMYGNPVDVPVPGRGGGTKVLGKHPMAGQGTVIQGNALTLLDRGDNLVRDRVISIMTVWLAHYLAKLFGPKGFAYYIVDAPKHTPWTGPRSPELNKGDEELKKACRAAVSERCKHNNLLIGGTTVQYENTAGSMV